MPTRPIAHFVMLFASALILFTTGTTSADDERITTWTIQERCLNTPTVPDENWTFDGEIMMSGWGGIHAISADYNTPYVVHWGRGVLSPDGQWVLSQAIDSEVEQLTGGGAMGRYHFYYDDIVARNIDTLEVVRFKWYAYISYDSRPYLAGPAELRWLDETHFAAFYGTYGREIKIGDVTTGTVTDWTNINFADYELAISPDQTRIHYYSQLYILPDNTLLREDIVGTNYDFARTLWSANSLLFADVLSDRETETETLALFDRDGNLIARPLAVVNGRVDLYDWSPTSAYLVFSANGEFAGNSLRGMYMLDVEAGIIYALCSGNAAGWAWSPDGRQFATIFGGGQQPIVITDMTNWQSVIAAFHTGYVQMWRTKT
ncbi:MAG: hypothetical protein SF123_26615 [Chloroflexota bacterium]|nr:hypothetical protein [Chloroflexota bacterium]